LANIVITGASAGLGKALALGYAAPDNALCLIARRREGLEAVAADCRARGATVVIAPLDVTERPAVDRALDAFEAHHPLDLVIANAGAFTGHGPDGAMETMDDLTWMVRTNLEGAAFTVNAAVRHMRPRKRGHVVITSSLAAMQPLADAPAYSASKAGIAAYGEALQEYLIPDNITVSLVLPGHVRTAQTDVQVGALHMIIDADVAAAVIRRGIERRRAKITFPLPLVMLIKAGRMLPWRLRAALGKDFRFHVRKTGHES